MKKKATLIFVFTVIFIISLLMTVKIFSKKGNVAVIYVAGEEYGSVDLQAVTKSYYITLPHNEILVEPGLISVSGADCPDKLCMKQGKKNGGLPIICLPGRVYIVFETREGADALSW